jgi:DNA-binding LytR/AlgR family response regulator
MSKIRCIVIEDEPLAIKVLTDYISNVPFLKLEGTYKNALLAIEYLRDHTVDLIFLDIHLPKLTGMAFLKALVRPPSVIITTAYHQYAVEGFELNVTDYLLKPFDFERFLAAVNKVKTTRSQMKDFISLNVQKKKIKIPLEDIMYIESQREYIKVVTTKNQYVSKISTREVEALLPSDLFKRIHRSYIISIARIEAYTSDSVELQGVTIPVGREYKDVVKGLG